MSVPSPNSESSKSQQKILLVSLGLVVGFALSVFLYFLFSGLGSIERDAATKDSLHDKFGVLDDTDALLERMAFERTSSTDFTTSDLRKVGEDLQNFDTEELRKAFQNSASLPYTRSLHPIQEMLCEHLVERSPVVALSSLVFFDENRVQALLRIMARQLVLQDLKESFKLVAGLKQPYRKIAIETMLGELEITEEVLSSLKALNDAEIETVLAKHMHEQKIHESIDQDPSTAFDLLLTDEIEDADQADLFSHVLNELFQVEGFDTFKRLNSIRENRELYAELFVQIAALDRVGTLNYLENLSTSRRSGLIYPLMENWVKVDVEAALAAINELPNPTLRSSAYSAFVHFWGYTRPFEVLNRLLEIPREHRSTAVLNVVRTLGATNPDEVLRLLPSLKATPGAFTYEIERTFIYSWASEFPDQALKWVQENAEPKSEQRDRMLHRVLGEYALVHPKKAMEVAVVEDPNPRRGELGLAYSVIDALLLTDQIDAALGLLDQVPKNNLTSTYASVAEQLVSEERFNDAISLSDTFTTADKVAYFSKVTNRLSSTNSTGVITLVAKIPDANVRLEVVNQILDDEWSIERDFTEEQVEKLRSLVVD